MKALHIAEDFMLPAEAVTQTFAILAKRGMGKTYTGKVFSEEMLEAGLHVVVVDPVGVWWGLRSSADGESDGLQIVIAGGEHADIPLTPESGEILADLVVDRRVSLVLDLSLLRKGQQIKFMTDFAETLYRRNREALHLILDEADAFAPQRPQPGENRMLGAIEDIVRRGRARGIGVTMITQRPAVLNKNILTQIEVLVALRLTAPNDQKAVDEWVKTHAEAGQREEFMSSLPSLPVGNAWFWSPGWLNVFQKVQVRRLKTLDSSSTPKIGEIKKAAKLAPVDIEALREQLAATIEQVNEKDPAVLQQRIKELETALADRNPQVEYHQVEVLPRRFKEYIADIHKQVMVLESVVEGVKNWVQQFSEASDTVSQFSEVDTRRISEMPQVQAVDEMLQPAPDKPYFKPIRPVRVAQDVQAGDAVAVMPDGEVRPYKMSKAAGTFLNVLGQYPLGCSKAKLSIVSGYSAKSSTFANGLGELRSRGYVSPAGVEPITITQAGLEAAPEMQPLPTGKELIDYWMGKLGKSEQAMLRALTAAYPQPLTYDDLQERTGYSRSSSTFANAVGRLRTLGLATRSNPVRASNILFGGVE